MAQQFRPYLTEEEEAQIRASENAPIYTPGERLLGPIDPIEDIDFEVPKKEAGFWSSFKDSFTTLLDLPEAIDYGIKSDDTTREALIKAQEASGESLGGLENVKSVGDFWRWAKELAGGSAGFIAPAGIAAQAAKVGARAVGVVNPIAGIIAGSAVLLGQYLTSNLGRQAQANQERVDAGELEKEASIAAAAASASGQTALDVVGLRFFPGLAKLLGFEGSKVTKETAEEIYETASKNIDKGKGLGDSLAKLEKQKNNIKTRSKTGAFFVGAGTGVAVEIPQELTQTILERGQAGLSLTDEDARKEYIETVAGAALLGGSFGSVSNLATNAQKRAEKQNIDAQTGRLKIAQQNKQDEIDRRLEGLSSDIGEYEQGLSEMQQRETTRREEEAAKGPKLLGTTDFTERTEPEARPETDEEFLKTRIPGEGTKATEILEGLPEKTESPLTRALNTLNNPKAKKNELSTALQGLGVEQKLISKKGSVNAKRTLLQNRIDELQGKIDNNTLNNEEIKLVLPTQIQTVKNAVSQHEGYQGEFAEGKYPISNTKAKKVASIMGVKPRKNATAQETMQEVKDKYDTLQNKVSSVTGVSPEVESLAKVTPNEVTKKQSNSFFKNVKNTISLGKGVTQDTLARIARSTLGESFYVYKKANTKALETRIKKQKQKELEGEDKKQSLQVFLSKEKAEGATGGDGPVVRIPATPEMVTSIQAEKAGNLLIDIGDVNAVDIQQKGSSEFKPIQLRPEPSGKGVGVSRTGRTTPKRTRKPDTRRMDATREPADVSPSTAEGVDPTLEAEQKEAKKKQKAEERKAEKEQEAREELNTKAAINEELQDTLRNVPENYTEEQRSFLRKLGDKAQYIVLRMLPVKAIAEIWGDSISYTNKQGVKVYPIEMLGKYVEDLNSEIIGDTREAKNLSNNLQTYVNVHDKDGKGYALSRLLRLSSFYGIDATRPNLDQVYGDIIPQDQIDLIKRLYNEVGSDGQVIYRDIGNYFKNNFKKLETNLKVKINDLNLEPETKQELIKEIELQFNNVKNMDYYFPLQRQGKYWVNFKYKGQFVSQGYKTEAERDARKKVLDDLEAKGEVESVVSKDSEQEALNALDDGLSNTAFKGVMDILNKDKKVSADTISAIKSLYINTMPEASIYKNLQTRKNILGFEPDIKDEQAGQDVAEIFNSKVTSQTRQIAKLRYQTKMENAIRDIEDIINRGFIGRVGDTEAMQGELNNIEKERAKEVLKSLKDHYARIKEPDLGAELTIGGKQYNIANKVGQAGFYYYLATPAAAMVNLFQTPTVAAGLMAGKYGIKAQKEILKALGQITSQSFKRGILKERKTTTFTKQELYGKTGDPTIDNEKVTMKLPEGLPRDEQIALARGMREGVIEQTQVGDVTGDDLQGLSEESLRLSKSKFSRVHRVMFGAFQLAERVNREVTFLAAYRLAKKDPQALKRGDKYKDSYDYAKRITDRAHGDYSHSNSGLWFKSPKVILRSMLMFKKFPVMMYYNYYAALKTARKKGASKEEIAEARKQLMGMLGYGFVASGLQGIPLYFALEFAIGALMEGLDEDDEWMAPSEAIRTTIGELLYNGPIQTLTGAEIASRVGLGEAIVRMPSSEREGTMSQLIEALGGPGFAMVANLAKGYDIAMEGNFARGVEAASPVALKNILKAVRYTDEGTATTLKGVPITDDLNVFQTAMQLVGFTPAELSRQYDLNNARRVLSNEVNGKRNRLIFRGATAAMAGDKEELDDIIKEIRKFNKKYPQAGIQESSLTKSIKMRQRRLEQNAIYGFGGMNFNPKQIALFDVWNKEN